MLIQTIDNGRAKKTSCLTNSAFYVRSFKQLDIAFFFAGGLILVKPKGIDAERNYMVLLSLLLRQKPLNTLGIGTGSFDGAVS